MEKRRWKVRAAAVFCAVLLTGCVGNPYRTVEIPETEETTAAEQVLVIEPDEGTAEIVIEAGADGGKDGGMPGDGAASADGAAAGEAAGRQGIRLLFGGDVLLSDHVLGAYERGGGIAGVLDEGYRELIDEADYFIVNEEFPFSSRGRQAPDKQYTFRLPPERAGLFGELGIDAVTLANNHALDFGQEALLDTCEVLDGAGILHTGAGADLEEAKRPVILEQGGRRIVILGATRVIPEAGWAAGKNHPGMLATYDPSVLLAEISRWRAEADFVIVYVHWGIERSETPEAYQRVLGQQYIEAGADLVVGSHPHVLQGIEYYQGKPIVYSLGNFIFGSAIPRTMLLQVDIGQAAEQADAQGAGPEVTLRLLPGTSAAGYTRLLPEEKREEFYQYISGISFDVQVAEDGTVETEQAAKTIVN